MKRSIQNTLPTAQASQEGSQRRKRPASPLGSNGIPMSRMTRAQVMKIATERAHARYTGGSGKSGNLRQVDRYLTQVGRLFKSDELKLSLDTIEAPELPLTC